MEPCGRGNGPEPTAEQKELRRAAPYSVPAPTAGTEHHARPGPPAPSAGPGPRDPERTGITGLPRAGNVPRGGLPASGARHTCVGFLHIQG